MFQLRSVLQNRAMDVLSSTDDTALSNLKIFFEFLNNNLLLKSILTELLKELPDFEPILAEIKSKREIVIPSSYLEKIKVCVSGLQYLIRKNEKPRILVDLVSSYVNLDIMTKEALEQFFKPVYIYIDEQVSNIDLLVYLLSCFKLKSEWFDKHNLFDSYSKDTAKGEKILDEALRSYLFDHGIHFPFSKPRSPSGEVDILPIVEMKPIPLEVKIFDGESRGSGYVKQGVYQAFLYARDYSKPSAYIVIFNVSPYDLVFKLSSSDVPQRLVTGDKTIFLFTIGLHPHEKTASKRVPQRYVIEEEYLLKQEN